MLDNSVKYVGKEDDERIIRAVDEMDELSIDSEIFQELGLLGLEVNFGEE